MDSPIFAEAKTGTSPRGTGPRVGAQFRQIPSRPSRPRPASVGRVCRQGLGGVAELGHRRDADRGGGRGGDNSRLPRPLLQSLSNVVSHRSQRQDRRADRAAAGRDVRRRGDRRPALASLSSVLLPHRLRSDILRIVVGRAQRRGRSGAGVARRRKTQPGAAILDELAERGGGDDWGRIETG